MKSDIGWAALLLPFARAQQVHGEPEKEGDSKGCVRVFCANCCFLQLDWDILRELKPQICVGITKECIYYSFSCVYSFVLSLIICVSCCCKISVFLQITQLVIY